MSDVVIWHIVDFVTIVTLCIWIWKRPSDFCGVCARVWEFFNWLESFFL